MLELRKSSKAVLTASESSQMRRTAYWSLVKISAFSTRLEQAAQLAALFSKASPKEKVPVTYTALKNVKKPLPKVA